MDRYPYQQYHQPPPCAKGNDGGGGGGPSAPAYGPWCAGTPPPPYAYPPDQYAPAWPPVDARDPVNLNQSCFFPSYGASGSPSSHPSNPYVHVAPVSGSSGKSTTDTLFKVLGKCGKTLEDTTRKAGGVAGNVWQHLKTSPSPTDAAIARLTQGTKVFAEGGHDKIFLQSFGTLPRECLLKAFACYLSTSSGPVIGTLYLSTVRLAFCSDNPIKSSQSPGPQDMNHYKVVLQLNQLRAVNPSANRTNPSDKFIQIVTTDDHQFWFMGFVSYDKALKNLTEAFQQHSVRHHY